MKTIDLAKVGDYYAIIKAEDGKLFYYDFIWCRFVSHTWDLDILTTNKLKALWVFRKVVGKVFKEEAVKLLLNNTYTTIKRYHG